MKMGHEILESSVDLELHDLYQMRYFHERIGDFIIKDHSGFRYENNSHKMRQPHFSEQAKPDANVRSLISQLYQ